MKKLAIYFSDAEPMGDPFDLTYDNLAYKSYWEIYQRIIRDLENYNIDVFIVRGLGSYLGRGIFSHGWQVREGKLLEINNHIKVDLIFHRGSEDTIPVTYDCPIINHPNLERFTGDKIRVADFFSHISPKTKAINVYEEFVQVIKLWGLVGNDFIVLKKNFLYGGHGIHILPVKDVHESLYKNWKDVLVQEFIDSSVGIPGIIDGLHDIRVISINGEPVFTYVRVPAKGSFLANLSQGGTYIPLTLDRLPEVLIKLVKEINRRLEQYRPSILAADFFNSKDGFKLIELNSRPGVHDPDFSPEDKVFHDKMVQMLVGALS